MYLLLISTTRWRIVQIEKTKTKQLMLDCLILQLINNTGNDSKNKSTLEMFLIVRKTLSRRGCVLIVARWVKIIFKKSSDLAVD